MNRTDRLLALVVYFLALITLELTSPTTSGAFRTLAAGTSILVLYGMPVYLFVQFIRSRAGE
ncbi:hypothetical protein [Halorussus sp. MSC15.2]|uniref:hypothetical protein n=1 Tax=Halorussus sp. MSC15.2 TaxID=2283638 RepID=UPI0013D5870A|nr:hypothetical protein [Halorussus sp. MSC15.2]NEU55278.1 hypothetical protein [Halorussus sp. MSC15.2]